MAEPARLQNIPEYAVSELALALKRTVEDAYGFVRVRGELGRVTLAKSGHLYADLKDDKAVIASVMWKGSAGRLDFRPEEGLEVVCEGKLSTYPGRSQYQLIIERMAPAGVGALMALLEKRKKELAAEGLFDPARKRPLPQFPEVVGVVTSPTGAVIRDILHRIGERFPRRVLVWPALVQGQEAAAQVAAGIVGFNQLDGTGAVPRPDVLIVARGGGSIEDLWPFNEEVVVRAAAGSGVPLISAVGHETDVTLIDYAADKRAPTPTGAAELVTTPTRADCAERVAAAALRMTRAATGIVQTSSAAFASAARALPRADALTGPPTERLDRAGERLRTGLKARSDAAAIRFQRSAALLRPEALSRDLAVRAQSLADLSARLSSAQSRSLTGLSKTLHAAGGRLAARALDGPLRKATARLEETLARARAAASRNLREQAAAIRSAAARLEALNPRAVLSRGYALVRREEGDIVRSADALKPGERVRLEFSDGAREAAVDGAAIKPKRKKRSGADDQGALF